MRTTCSSSNTKILPSPILPVFADFSIASITCSTMSLLIAASILTFGRKSTTYSAPRYNSVWPFCRPKPLTSVTVMPCTPMADNASRTSSSLNGLMMAVTSFMKNPLALSWRAEPRRTRYPRTPLERLADRQHQTGRAGLADLRSGTAALVARVPVLLVGVGADDARAEQPSREVVDRADLEVEVI